MKRIIVLLAVMALMVALAVPAFGAAKPLSYGQPEERS